MRSLFIISLAAIACEAGSSARASQLPKARTASATDSTPRAPALPDTVRRSDTTIVRGLYVLRWASQSPARMKQLIAIADSTEAIRLDPKFVPAYVERAFAHSATGMPANVQAICDLTWMCDTQFRLKSALCSSKYFRRLTMKLSILRWWSIELRPAAIAARRSTSSIGPMIMLD
jgi:hypothetical protein